MFLLLLSTACRHDKKPDTQPGPVAAAPEKAKAAPASAATTPPATTAKPASGSKTKPPAAATAKSTAATSTKPRSTTTKPQPAAAPQTATAAPTLDLDALRARLRETKAIGLMTKLSLKNQVDDLLDGFRKHYAGKATPTVTELRRTYDMLMMKVLSLLQDHDKKLASDILSSRERIWGLLADPTKFAALQA
jgi:hypothetical protein